MKELIFKILRPLTYPFAIIIPLRNWNYWLGRIHDIKLYSKVKPFPTLTSGGSANINIIIDLIKETEHIEGNIAECGVFRGSTLVSTAYYLKQINSKKKILGFDSFEGFDNKDLDSDLEYENSDNIKNEAQDFANNSLQLVINKLKLAKVENQTTLVQGYFEDTLKNYSNEKFCFVHLDCDLYEPYKVCLDFFYPRLQKGSIVLFDEYNDPVYTRSNLAIDGFLNDKPEKLETITRDNQQRFFFRKL